MLNLDRSVRWKRWADGAIVIYIFNIDINPRTVQERVMVQWNWSSRNLHLIDYSGSSGTLRTIHVHTQDVCYLLGAQRRLQTFPRN